MQLVKDRWEGNNSVDILQKVQQCGEKLEIWGKEITRNFSRRIKACKAEIRILRNRRDDQATARFKEVKK